MDLDLDNQNINNKKTFNDLIATYPSATQFFNFFLNDPLLDYLDKYGLDLGFNEEPLPPETIHLMSMGNLFEKKVIDAIREKDIFVAEIPKFEYWLDGIFETIQLMKEGVPIISQGHLVNNFNKTKGHPDLLVRSDYLNLLKPGLISEEEQHKPSYFGDFHYRVIDIKMSNIFLSSDGNNILNQKIYKGYKAQVLVYNLALSLIQNYNPEQGYILGRSSHNYDYTIYNNDCFSSISMINYKEGHKDNEIINELNIALEWKELLKTIPKVSKKISINQELNIDLNIDSNIDSNIDYDYDWDELEKNYLSDINSRSKILISLRPNMKNKYDCKWKTAKKIIANQREELTLLWNCGFSKRNKALSNGITTWKDYKQYCIDEGGYINNVLASILEINDSNNLELFNPRIEKSLKVDLLELIPPKNKPFIVLDFETSNNLNDEFDNLPEKGGDDFIFLIGITIIIPFETENQEIKHEYRYFPFVVDQLNIFDELKIFKKMISLIDDLLNWLNIDRNTDRLTLNHWSAAERTFFDNLIDRQYDELDSNEQTILDCIDFNDILYIFKEQPITVKGAYDFSLKTIGNALYNLGLIKTIWTSDLNGFNVMLEMSKYNIEAEKLRLSLKDYKEVNEIILYNMIDCNVLAEIIVFLQKYL